jgi:AraC-like DNA-binding protein
MRYFTPPASGNPSAITQEFAPFKIELLCCHYWWLQVWNHQNLSFPYWRIYWNSKPGASIVFAEKRWDLSAGQLVIIAPNTPFSTEYDPEQQATGRSDYLVGGPLDTRPENREPLEHLFVHFNLGSPYDQVSPHIYVVDVDPHLERRLSQLCAILKDEPELFGRTKTLLLNAIIADLLFRIPDEEWTLASSDERIKSTIEYIDRHLADALGNESLARRVNMATNSFARLFRQETGTPLQHYVYTRRVEKACILLHHSRDSIEKIAEACGFCDRYHFSRMFKKSVGKPPADYRNSFRYEKGSGHEEGSNT